MIKCGDHTYGKLISIGDQSDCIVGKYCSISEKVIVILGAEHNTDWCSTYPFNIFNGIIGYNHPKTNGDIIIGNDVWIGYGVMILSGVHIGDGVIIGAKSVIRNNISDYSIVIGNPEVHVGYRFDALSIKRFKEMKWWDWDEEKIEEAIPLLLSKDVDKLYKYYLEKVKNG